MGILINICGIYLWPPGNGSSPSFREEFLGCAYEADGFFRWELILPIRAPLVTAVRTLFANPFREVEIQDPRLRNTPNQISCRSHPPMQKLLS